MKIVALGSDHIIIHQSLHRRVLDRVYFAPIWSNMPILNMRKMLHIIINHHTFLGFVIIWFS